MTRTAKVTGLFKVTASSLIITTMLAGCKPAAMAERPRSSGSAMSVTDRLASKVAAEAAQAMAAGHHDQAVDLAERIVAASPQDAGYRTLLAQAYLRAGRFVSADQAFADVIRLMPDNDKARVAQAVAKIAQGDRLGARAVLADVRNAPADDYGLALALVGDSAKAVSVLDPAARGMRGTSRTRQNLALAYALGGQWDKARAVAAQDISPSEIDRRMQNWARLASPEARDMQVAALLGTTPVADDPGQPVMLALVKPQPAEAPVQAAEAAPAEAQAVTVAEAVASAPVAGSVPDRADQSVARELAAAVVPAPVPVPAVVPEVAPQPEAPAATEARKVAIEVAVADAVAPQAPQPVVDDQPKLTTKALSSMTRVAFEPAPVRKTVRSKGEWVVQLGAYSSARRVEAGWVRLSDNFQRLAQYTPSHSVYTVTATGATFHRLSVTGFATRTSASALCGAVKAQGGSCFVRRQGNEAPIRMVSSNRTQVASIY